VLVTTRKFVINFFWMQLAVTIESLVTKNVTAVLVAAAANAIMDLFPLLLALKVRDPDLLIINHSFSYRYFP
jgi:hypothetical protein